MRWKCPVCGKEFENFGFKEFSQCPKTTLFGNFKKKTVDGEIQMVNRLINNQCVPKNVRKETKINIL